MATEIVRNRPALETRMRRLMTHPAGVTLIATLIATCIGVFWYGSPRAALAAIRGREFLIDSETKSIGELRAGEKRMVRFHVKNLTGRPIRILGGLAACTCMLPRDLPLVISPWAEGTIEIEVRAIGSKPKFDQEVRFYTSASSQHEFVVHVVGTSSQQSSRNSNK